MSNAGYGNHDAPPPGSTPPPEGERSAGGKAAPEPPGATERAPAKERPVATPGDGAGPQAPQGDEVDPGTG